MYYVIKELVGSALQGWKTMPPMYAKSIESGRRAVSENSFERNQ
jgi:hypothetical protein